jgi:16S rRNA (uracil1498-N3)-methyltransferase
MEVIVQKATELGAAIIQPVISEHVVSRLDEEDAARKVEKWQRTAIEAMKQCGAPWLPEVRAPRYLPELAASRSAEAEGFLGSLRESSRWLRAWTAEWQTSLPTSVGLWVGPEGDFSDGELRLLEASGAKPFTMGGNVLRSETAAVCALAVLSYELALALSPPYSKLPAPAAR